MTPALTPRRLWTLFEPLHAVTYFSERARAAMEQAGLRGFWRGYFAGRSAALGPIAAAPVVALFHGFAPGMVERALPAVWSLVTPEQALAARLEGARAALAAFPSAGDRDRVAEAADLAMTAAGAAPVGGRALAAAHAALPWPDDALGRLWQAATVLREHRGDGHVVALTCAGLSGLEALLLRAGSDLARTVLQPARGWTDAEWDAGSVQLVERGLLDPAGRITPAGGELLRDVETVTDHLAAQPWAALGAAAAGRFADLVRPLSRAAAASMPQATPIGLPDAPDL
jgi:hypothetical protein